MNLLDARHAARVAPDATALIVGGDAISFAALATRIDLMVSAVHRAAPGDAPIAFVARLDRASLELFFALLACGATAVPLHPRLAEEAIAARVAAVPGARLIDPVEVARAADRAAPLDASLPTQPRLCLFTSGTTGAARAAVLSHDAIVASARASEDNLGWWPADRWLLTMPLAHAGGASILTRCLLGRRAVVVHPAFDVERTLRAPREEGVTLLSVVPTMLRDLVARDRGGALGALRAALVGGAACPPGLVDEAWDHGLLALPTYGLTEAGSQVTTRRLRDPYAAGRTDSGKPLLGTRVRVVGPDGEEREAGERGRIEVVGPTLFDGYAGRPPMPPGAWFATSDVGHLDVDGALHVHGRFDDVIVTGGENVHPLAVEAALADAPGLADALVFGVPDERWGEVVAVALVAAPGAEREALLAHLEAEVLPRLASFERPRRVAFVEALPLGATGKPDRRAARATLSPVPWGAALTPSR